MKTPRHRLALAAATTLALAGCAAPSFDVAMRDASALAAPVAGATPTWLARTPSQQQAAARLTDGLLAQPLSADGAVQVALANSPAFQATLADGWSDLAAARQRALPGGVTFSFERLREGTSLELGRLISVGLFELLTLPQRARVAQLQGEHTRVKLAGAIADQATAARQAWVRAVAAREIETYAVQVQEAAEASAELARRMQRVGNFTKLQAARQHLFYADATARLASARQAAVATREALVRQLGLTDAQANVLKLPDRLPDLPKAPKTAGEIAQAVAAQRLDARLARLELEVAGRSRGVDLAAGLVDVELGGRRDTHFDGHGDKSTTRGWEVELRLPLFDWGATRQAALDARSLAAVHRYEAVARAANSQVRESYAAYRTAFDLAKHQRDEVVPLRKTISEENVLRYNGMLIGVFELLADARDQVSGVIAAIEAQREFWLADAALASTLIGRPQMGAGAESPPAAATTAGGDAGH